MKIPKQPKSDWSIGVAFGIVFLVLGLFLSTAKSGGTLDPDYNPYFADDTAYFTVAAGKTISHIEGERLNHMSSRCSSLIITFTDGTQIKIVRLGKHSIGIEEVP